MTFQYYIELFATILMMIVAVVSTFFAIRALIQKRYGFGGWLNKPKYIVLITAAFCACYSFNLYSENLALYHEYVIIRDEYDRVCFDGGNAGHKEQIAALDNGLAKCRDYYEDCIRKLNRK